VKRCHNCGILLKKKIKECYICGGKEKTDAKMPYLYKNLSIKTTIMVKNYYSVTYPHKYICGHCWDSVRLLLNRERRRMRKWIAKNKRR